MSNSLDPDQAKHFAKVPIFLKMFSVADKLPLAGKELK